MMQLVLFHDISNRKVEAIFTQITDRNSKKRINFVLFSTNVEEFNAVMKKIDILMN